MGALHGQTYTLTKTIAAIQGEFGDSVGVGPVVELPGEMNVTVLGPGFHASLVKVRCNAGVYFVFMDDLDRNLLRSSG